MGSKKDKEEKVTKSKAGAFAPWEKGYEPCRPKYAPAQLEMLARLNDDVSHRLWGRRLDHVRGVAETSVWLASRCGADLYQAEVAGLLHDWDKKLGPEELWEKVDRYGIDVPRVEDVLPVLHGLTAAASLPEDYPELPAEVFRAVERHTTGAVGMSDLDMVVYVADMIEPGRSGKRIEALRELSKRVEIRQVYAECVRLGLMHLLESGRFVYPDALEVWNDCRKDAPASDSKE